MIWKQTLLFIRTLYLLFPKRTLPNYWIYPTSEEDIYEIDLFEEDEYDD